MTLPDYLTLSLSIVAFVFSIITFVYNTYEQYLKAAKLQLVLGSELQAGFLDGKQKFGFWVPVALANQGAVDAVVLEIKGVLTGPDSKEVQVEWCTVGDYDGANHQFVPKGWTDTLIVSSRRATTAWIGLQTAGDVTTEITGGDYNLRLHVLAPVGGRRGVRTKRDGTRIPAASWTGKLTLTQAQAQEVQAPRAAAPVAGFRLSDMQLVTVQGATPRNAIALVPGLRDPAAA